MPNHCYNRVQISNDAEDNSKQFDELVAIFESQKPFSKIIPIPDYTKIPNEDGELPVRVEHKNSEGEVLFTIMEFPKSKKETIDGISFVLPTGELSGKHTIFLLWILKRIMQNLVSIQHGGLPKEFLIKFVRIILMLESVVSMMSQVAK